MELVLFRCVFMQCACLLIIAAQGREQRTNATQKNTSSIVAMEIFQDDANSKKSKGRAVDMETVSCDDDDVEQQLILRLLKGHDKHVRPVTNRDQNMNVGFDMSYNQLVDLDGKKQILTSKVWVRQVWYNAFLTWNKTKYCNISMIQLHPELIWKPDIVLYNSIGISAGGEMYTFNTMINIYHDGKNQWWAPTEIKSICHINIAYFPFDRQICHLKFGSWTRTTAMLNLSMSRPGTADLSMYYVNGEWELQGVPGKRNQVNYNCCKNPFADITYKIILKRRVLFYVNNLVMPNLILAGLVVFSFYVPPESGERISLNITILLGLTVFLLLFNERIPPSSEVVPLIGAYYFALFYQVGISMILTCVTSRCYHHNAFRKMPRWFRFLIFRVLAPVFRMQNSLSDPEPPAKPWYPTEIKYKNPQKILLYKSANGTIKLKERQDTEFLTANGDDDIPRISEPTHTSLESKIDGISRQLGVFVDHLSSNEEIESRKKEWQFASIVLDKFFFWFFALSITLTVTLFYWKINQQATDLDDTHAK